MKNLLKYFSYIFSLMLLFNTSYSNGETKMLDDNCYQFSFLDIKEKEDISLDKFKGKVILIVNTASNCGFTGQYKGLEELYKKYKDQGLQVIAVPSNDFGGQEPGSNEEVEKFCSVNYGVTFLVTKKEIVSGKSAHPFYKWAKEKMGLLSAPKWNFHKYLIDRKGNLVEYYFSTTSPEDKKLIKEIEKLLHQ